MRKPKRKHSFPFTSQGRRRETQPLSKARMTNANLQLYYATRDGQSRRIAAHIADRLGEHGMHTMPQDLEIVTPQPQNLSRASLLVLIAAVRYGRHLPEAEQLLKTYGDLTSRPPLVLASVNLTARKP